MSSAETITMLSSALLGLSTRLIAESDPCWCSDQWCSPQWIAHDEHSPACLDARAALAAAVPEPVDHLAGTATNAPEGD